MKSSCIKLVLFLVGILSFPGLLIAQETYKAKVVDTLKKPVRDASVILKDTKNRVVSYDLTNENGFFTLEIPATGDTLYIFIRKSGYKSLKKSLKKGFFPPEYILKPWEETLGDIVITESAVRKKGDTIIYRAKSFMSQNDIVVEDLLRKLPGITVSEDGTISYMGKPVNHFFVENLDMTGGRYQRITKRLQADAVKSVQLIENYNEIKALAKKHTEQVALNLILKDKFYKVLSVKAELEEQIKNGLIEPDFMVFGKRRQAGINVNLNNAGQTSDDRILSLNITDILAGFTLHDYRIDRTSVDNVPPLQGNKTFIRYNLNNSNQLRSDLSYLFLTRSNNQFRINTYFSRKQIFLKNKRRYQFLSGLQIPEILETTTGTHTENTGEVEISYTVDKPEKYFKNLTRFRLSGDDYQNLFSRNQSASIEDIQKPWFYFKNNLRTVHPLGKGRLETNQLLEINRSGQNYGLNPILFANALFQTGDTVLQRVKYNLTSFNQHIKWHKSIKSTGSFSLPSITYGFLQYDITSRMRLNGITLAADSLRNDYRIRNHKIIFNQTFEKKKNRYFFRLNLPVYLRSFLITNLHNRRKTNISRLDWQPDLFIKYSTGNSTHTFGFRYQNIITELPQSLPGYILVSRRRLESGEVFISEKSAYNFFLNFDRFNYIKAFNISLRLNYTFGTDKQIPRYNLNTAGFYSVEYLKQKAPYTRQSLSLNAAKFFNEPNISVKGSYMFTYLKNYQIRNGEKLPVFRNNHNANLSVQADVRSYRLGLDFDYALGDLSFKNTRFTNRIFTLKSSLTKNLNKKFSLKAGIFYMKNINRSFRSDLTAANLTFQWKTSAKSQVYLRINNVFNRNQYVVFSGDLYSIGEERYFLRPREIYLGVNLRF